MNKSNRNNRNTPPAIQAAYPYSCTPKRATDEVRIILNQPKMIALLSYCKPAKGSDMESKRLGFCQHFAAHEVRDLHAVNSSMGQLLDKLAADYKAEKPALMEIIDAYKSSLEENSLKRVRLEEELSAFRGDDVPPEGVAEAGESAIPVRRARGRRSA